MPPTPFFRESGAGPGVVCLHSNASSSNQWRALGETLSPRFRVLAADSYGAGKSPPWPTNRAVELQDEVALLEPVFVHAGDPFALVGHSYGGAVALMAALAIPHRVRAMALYEPTLFSLVDAASPPPNEADGIRAAVADAVAAVDAGDLDSAARCFIGYWMGAATWDHMPEPRRGPIAASMINVGRWAAALLGEPTPLAAFSSLNMPVLCMVGRDSPASSLRVSRLLTSVLPRAETVEFDGLGHMGPITHPAVVNEAISRFLDRL